MHAQVGVFDNNGRCGGDAAEGSVFDRAAVAMRGDDAGVMNEPLMACHRPRKAVSWSLFIGLYRCVSAASGGDHGRAAYGRTVRSLQREVARGHVARAEGAEFGLLGGAAVLGERAPDRKSTRLNSSHLGISY